MARHVAAARQARHRSTTARASSASPTGPSSSSPRAPARTAPASCPSSSATPTTPRSAGPPPTSPSARLVGDSDETPEPQAAERRRRRAPRSTSAAPLGRPDAALGGRHRRRRAGCWASTRSTSPTSRAPRRPPAGCSTPPAAPAAAPAFTDGAIEVRALGGDWLGVGDHRRRRRSTRCSTSSTRTSGYVAVMAYLDRLADAAAGQRAAPALARRTGRPTTFGWGPRFLHSTGQFHKGGPATGVYLQITTAAARGPAGPRARRSPSATSSPPRPLATPRCWPTTAARCCACTSPTTTRVWPS